MTVFKTARLISTILTLFVLVLLAFPCRAVPQTIGTDELKPGMKGFGLTVFSGTSPERFEVEVIDVVPNFMVRQDIILVKCFHPITDKAGVIGGMSGSPIFIEGKLAGALAYAWSFSKEAVAGVTPISPMLKLLERKQRPATKKNPYRKLSFLKNPATYIKEKLANSFFSHFNSSEGSRLSPVKTPLALSGFNGRSKKMLEKELKPFGLVTVQGGGKGSRQEGPSSLGQGDAVGVQVIRGDLSATGIGTVTMAEKNNILALGHPMFNMGENYLPVTSARIHTVVSSLARSNKIGSPLREIGSLVQDRRAGIMARTDIRADTISVRFDVEDMRNGFKDSFDVEVANRHWLSGKLIHASLVQFIQHAASDMTDVTASVSSRIKIRNRPMYTLEDSGVSRAGLTPLIKYFRPAAVIHAVLSNPFEDVVIENIAFDVKLEYGLSYSSIKGIYLTSEQPRAGEQINLHIRLIDYGGKERIVTLPVRIPAYAEGRKIKITAGGGSNIKPVMPIPEDLDDVLRNVRMYYPTNSIVVTMEMQTQSLTVRGNRLEDLPGSAIEALEPSAGDDDSKKYKSIYSEVIEQDSIISGKNEIDITAGRQSVK